MADNDRKYLRDEQVYDDNNNKVSPLDDDYAFWKAEQERITNPLSDEYNKYDNE